MYVLCTYFSYHLLQLPIPQKLRSNNVTLIEAKLHLVVCKVVWNSGHMLIPNLNFRLQFRSIGKIPSPHLFFPICYTSTHRKSCTYTSMEKAQIALLQHNTTNDLT